MNIFKVQNPRQPKICDVVTNIIKRSRSLAHFVGKYDVRNITTITLRGVVSALDLSKETVQKNICVSRAFYMCKSLDFDEEDIPILMAGNFLGDGRKLCSDCYVIEAVRAFYMCKSLDFDEDIPILMVDQDELNRVNRPYEPAYNKPKPDGLMLLGPPFPTNPIVTIQRCSKRGERIQVKKKVDKLTMLQYLPGIFRCDKKVISLVIRFLLNKALIRVVLLCGQPDVVIGGILAHEMMHAWLALRLGLYRKLETWVEEDNECEIYGRGFRLAMEAVKTYGLHATLEHIVSTGSLPKQDDHQDQMETPFIY
ncbi:hypothetical protein ACFX1S_028957 [Malus domestica]